MAIIQVQIKKNTIEDVLLNRGSKVNIITKQLKLKLGLPKPKLAPYNLKMANQTTIKPVGLIKDLKIYVHGIPYIITFTILQNSVVDFNYSMLLGRPWLKDVNVATLALGSRQRQRLARVHDKREVRETHLTPGSAGKCERMNPHTPKATPTWGVGVPMDSRILKKQLQGSKLITLKSFLYH